MNNIERQILKNQNAIMSIIFHGNTNTSCRTRIIEKMNETSELLNPIEQKATREPTLAEQTHEALSEKDKFGRII